MILMEAIGKTAVAVLVSAVAALIAASCAFALITFIGARFFSGEAGYGVGLAFGPLGALLAGAMAFVVAFRKIRSF
jgi:hypothetical protein